MLKIKDKFIDHSENVECAIDRVSLGNDNQIIIQHRLSVRVTFKDWWKFFTGQDCLHVTTKTIIEYEETNNICCFMCRDGYCSKHLWRTAS